MAGPGKTGGVSFFKVTNGEMNTSSFRNYGFGDLQTPGPAPQDYSRPHGVATDPSEKFAVVPDLGADKLHVFGLNISGAGEMILRTDLEVLLPRGSGPRHATFFRHTLSKDTIPQWYLFVVNELRNTLMTFHVSYNSVDGSVNLNLTGPTREISTLADTIGLGLSNMTDVVQNTKAAEIKISPDNRFLTVSNRNVTSSTFQGYVDSLVTFSINADGSFNPLTTEVWASLAPVASTSILLVTRSWLLLRSTRLLRCMLGTWRVGRLVTYLLCCRSIRPSLMGVWLGFRMLFGILGKLQQFMSYE